VHDLANYGEDCWNLDSNVADLQVNGHKQHSKAPAFAGNGTSPRLCLTSQQWHSLQSDAHATWDLLSDEAKAIILALCKDPGKQLVANLHNISAYDFIQANFHDSHVDDATLTTPHWTLLMTMGMLKLQLKKITSLSYLHSCQSRKDLRTLVTW